MDQHAFSPEVSYHADHSDSKAVVKKIIRTTVLLSVITLIELALGYTIFYLNKDANHSTGLVLFIKGVIVILSLAKAFYIVSIFMHLGDEVRNLIMTIIVPLLLFVWFIGAFMWDGNSYKNLRNNYDRHHSEQSKVKPENKKPAEEGHGGEVKPESIH